jgi:hypothetical protein
MKGWKGLSARWVDSSPGADVLGRVTVQAIDQAAGIAMAPGSVSRGTIFGH